MKLTQFATQVSAYVFCLHNSRGDGIAQRLTWEPKRQIVQNWGSWHLSFASSARQSILFWDVYFFLPISQGMRFSFNSLQSMLWCLMIPYAKATLFLCFGGGSTVLIWFCWSPFQLWRLPEATVMLVGATLSQRQLLEFLFKERSMDDKVVVSDILYFHPYLGESSYLTHIFSHGLRPSRRWSIWYFS